MPTSSDHEDLAQHVTREIQHQLSRSDSPVMLEELVYQIAIDRTENDIWADTLAHELFDSVLPEHSRYLVYFGYEEWPGIGLQLLDLGTGVVFVLLDRTSIDEDTVVMAEMASGDTDALRKYVMHEMAYGASSGDTLCAWPEAIEVEEPVTNDDVRGVFKALLIPSGAMRGVRRLCDSCLRPTLASQVVRRP